MGKVFERVFNSERSEDFESTFELADKLAGRRLDRRRNYLIAKGEVRQLHTWTQNCSGCSDCNEHRPGSRGAGCSECGYHGVVRQGMYLPLQNNRKQPK